MSAPARTTATTALVSRLTTVQDTLGTDGPRATVTGEHLVDALADLVEAVGAERDRVWLLIVGLTAAMPDQALVHFVARNLSLREPDAAVNWLLDTTASLALDHGSIHSGLRIVTEQPLLDVGSIADGDPFARLPSVLYDVAAEWIAAHDLAVVGWTPRAGAFQALGDRERDRLLERLPLRSNRHDRPAAGTGHHDPTEIVVPWGVPVVVAGAPSGGRSDRLAALGELTPSSIRLVGYDCVPVSSAETVDPSESSEFSRYLELVKHSDRVAGVSRVAADEFAGFSRALAAQGLGGPRVVACPMPTDLPIAKKVRDPHRGGRPGREPKRPLVLCVGDIGARHNQARLLEAAELLWQDSLEFELRILGRAEPGPTPVEGVVSLLNARGRHLVVKVDPSGAQIAAALSRARCLVFPTLHASYSLAVIQALSAGVPVVTSDFGGGRELAESQGGLLVDPMDVDALAGAIRCLLTDDTLHAGLSALARARPERSQNRYAAELWDALLS